MMKEVWSPSSGISPHAAVILVVICCCYLMGLVAASTTGKAISFASEILLKGEARHYKYCVLQYTVCHGRGNTVFYYENRTQGRLKIIAKEIVQRKQNKLMPCTAG